MRRRANNVIGGDLRSRRSVRLCTDRLRRGYSLLELLIVLAVLVTIASLTLPALRGPLDRSRLRSAGREMQTQLAKARSLAIRSGKEHWLRYKIDGTEWRIETTPDETDLAANADGPVDALILEAEAVVVGEDKLVREGDLPGGVVFSEVQPNAADSLLQATPTAEELLLELAAEAQGQATWSEPIRFSPNGRTADATILISGSRDFVTRVKLRGLTGVAIARTVRRQKTEPLDDLLQLTQPETKPQTERIR